MALFYPPPSSPTQKAILILLLLLLLQKTKTNTPASSCLHYTIRMAARSGGVLSRFKNWAKGTSGGAKNPQQQQKEEQNASVQLRAHIRGLDLKVADVKRLIAACDQIIQPKMQQYNKIKNPEVRKKKILLDRDLAKASRDKMQYEASLKSYEDRRAGLEGQLRRLDDAHLAIETGKVLASVQRELGSLTTEQNGISIDAMLDIGDAIEEGFTDIGEYNNAVDTASKAGGGIAGDPLDDEDALLDYLQEQQQPDEEEEEDDAGEFISNDHREDYKNTTKTSSSSTHALLIDDMFPPVPLTQPKVTTPKYPSVAVNNNNNALSYHNNGNAIANNNNHSSAMD